MFKPIAEFEKTDDYDQPSLVLKTDIGLLFYGEWDPASGYFFVTDYVNQPFTSEQKEFLERMELPGRLYATVTGYRIYQ